MDAVISTTGSGNISLGLLTQPTVEVSPAAKKAQGSIRPRKSKVNGGAPFRNGNIVPEAADAAESVGGHEGLETKASPNEKKKGRKPGKKKKKEDRRPTSSATEQPELRKPEALAIDAARIDEDLRAAAAAQGAWNATSAEPLNGLLRAICQQLQPSAEDHQKRVNLMDRLNKVLDQVYICEGGKLVPFGSFESNFYTPWGDLDLSLECPYDFSGMRRDNCKRLKVDILRAVCKKLLKLGGVYDVQLLAQARVPVLMFVDRRTGLACDITVGNDSALLKSRVLRWVSQLDDRIRHLIFLVKCWAKAQSINDPKTGTLNSYALSLLLLFHLQTRSPPLVPPLQDILTVNDSPKLACDAESRARKKELAFDACEARLKALLADGYAQRNTSTLGELFSSFFAQFAAVSHLWKGGLAASTFAATWKDDLSVFVSWPEKDYYMRVKCWAKAQSINDPKTGTLNSYALSLLLLFHLQTRSPPLVPPLQDILTVNDSPKLACDAESRARKKELAFDACEARLKALLADGYAQRNTSTLGELFSSFFAQFAAVSHLWKGGLAASTFAATWKDDLSVFVSWPEKDYYMRVEDAFDLEENCARSVRREELPVICDAFQRSAKLLAVPPGESSLEQLRINLFGWPQDDPRPTMRHVADVKRAPPPPRKATLSYPPVALPLPLPPPEQIYYMDPALASKQDDEKRHLVPGMHRSLPSLRDPVLSPPGTRSERQSSAPAVLLPSTSPVSEYVRQAALFPERRPPPVDLFPPPDPAEVAAFAKAWEEVMRRNSENQTHQEAARAADADADLDAKAGPGGPSDSPMSAPGGAPAGPKRLPPHRQAGPPSPATRRPEQPQALRRGATATRHVVGPKAGPLLSAVCPVNITHARRLSTASDGSRPAGAAKKGAAAAAARSSSKQAGLLGKGQSGVQTPVFSAKGGDRGVLGVQPSPQQDRAGPARPARDRHTTQGTASIHNGKEGTGAKNGPRAEQAGHNSGAPLEPSAVQTLKQGGHQMAGPPGSQAKATWKEASGGTRGMPQPAPASAAHAPAGAHGGAPASVSGSEFHGVGGLPQAASGSGTGASGGNTGAGQGAPRHAVSATALSEGTWGGAESTGRAAGGGSMSFSLAMRGSDGDGVEVHSKSLPAHVGGGGEPGGAAAVADRARLEAIVATAGPGYDLKEVPHAELSGLLRGGAGAAGRGGKSKGGSRSGSSQGGAGEPGGAGGATGAEAGGKPKNRRSRPRGGKVRQAGEGPAPGLADAFGGGLSLNAS
eukprot:jgi/Mesen1/10768/ME000091S10296